MRFLAYALVAVVCLVEVGSVSANPWTIAPPGTAKSKEIKQMNIMERPNRLLHFYGDAVRMANRKK